MLNKIQTSFLGGTVDKMLAGALAFSAVIATTSTVSFQDIAEQTGVGADDGPRWVASLQTIPRGSTHGQVDEEADTFSTASLNKQTMVRTDTALHTINPVEPATTRKAMRVVTAVKGDRVYKPLPGEFDARRAALAMVKARPIVTPPTSVPVITASLGPSTGAAPEVENHLMALARTFRPTRSVVDEISRPKAVAGVSRMSGPDIVRGIMANHMHRVALAGRSTDQQATTTLASAVRIPLERGQLKEARAAARMMARVVSRVKQAGEAGDPVTVSSVTAAYAPQERDIATAFASVLRAPSGVIQLNRGDHKWAAKALPAFARSRAERRCLTTGIYFEARGEPVSGQKAVAQVILNRVKNPAYPGTICGVVYQNRWKRNACQFSFACDGIRDRVRNRKQWNVAKGIADDAVSGRFWLKTVGSASHYHADYVWPRWRRKMKRMTKIGRHIFYRTRKGGWS